MENSKNISYGPLCPLLPIALNKHLKAYELEHDDFYTITDKKGFKYYRVDIKHTDFSKLKKIIEECKNIENKNWNAQSDFYEYIMERDLLIYILKDNKIAGFFLLSYWVSDRYIVFGFDEAIVKKVYRGVNLALAMCGLASRTLYLKFSKQKQKFKYVMQILTPNISVINGIYKYRFLFATMEASTFKPDKNLMKIHDKLLLREKTTLVNKDYSFFFENIFPGSIKKTDKKIKCPEKLKKMIPPEVDFIKRGDSFAFLASFSMLTCLPGITTLMFKCFGKKYLTNNNIGIFLKNLLL